MRSNYGIGSLQNAPTYNHPKPAKRALLLINPNSRQGRKNRSAAVKHLEAVGIECVQAHPQHPSEFADTICQYRDRVDAVIIGGGDGTLNAAAEGLVETQLPLGILPLGTANDLARTLGIPTTLPLACQAIATGKRHRIDLGCVNGKYFFNVASIGLSVRITQRLTKAAKKRWGVFAYAVAAIQAIWQARPFSALIEHNQTFIPVKTIQIAIGNGRYYGGGMTVAHDATIDDQRLDLYSLEMKRWWQLLVLLPAFWSGRYDTRLGVRTLEGQEISIHTRSPFPINTDGEITSYTPAHFRLHPQAISVYIPANPPRRRF
ncbi:lipid kinase [Geitlerinema sp. PCC 9228]|jgi:YegS/Rv2252/BmrU family lipid kinase|uniref:lipid kinase n=1 Tax=Geitlerinema sp. PCC 9228 TaxID=111611 RepID=UPI0009FDF0CC|nr:lipid kinase [Geitlerinema sp. PCC 9228]